MTLVVDDGKELRIYNGGRAKVLPLDAHTDTIRHLLEKLRKKGRVQYVIINDDVCFDTVSRKTRKQLQEDR